MIFSHHTTDFPEPLAAFELDGHTHLIVNPRMVAAMNVRSWEALLLEVTRRMEEMPLADVIDLEAVRQVRATAAGASLASH